MAWSCAVMRTVPAGLSRIALSDSSSCAISCSRGASVFSSRAPASVTETLRVVRVSSRTPSRASSASIEWLSAERETPICAAARVKLRSRATTTKACRSLRFSVVTDELVNWIHKCIPILQSSQPMARFLEFGHRSISQELSMCHRPLKPPSAWRHSTA